MDKVKKKQFYRDPECLEFYLHAAYMSSEYCVSTRGNFVLFYFNYPHMFIVKEPDVTTERIYLTRELNLLSCRRNHYTKTT
jgi:hypothetical protein